MLAGVELGGTKAIAVIGHGRTIVDRTIVPTTTPDATLGALADWLARSAPCGAGAAHGEVAGLGIASFGPIDVHPGSPGYGRMLATPKPGWSGADILGVLAAAMPAACRIHTDVTAAALAEGRWGAAIGMTDFVYVTIGTGIGMGIVAGGRPLTGSMHPEAGHLRVRRMAGDDFAGVCPFHADCLEGLASGPAIAARTGRSAADLPADDPGWTPVADAIAEGFTSLLLTLSPRAIIVGGGVGVGRVELMPMVRRAVVAKLGGYLPFVDRGSVETLIVPALLSVDAGPLGALALAASAARGLDRRAIGSSA